MCATTRMELRAPECLRAILRRVIWYMQHSKYKLTRIVVCHVVACENVETEKEKIDGIDELKLVYAGKLLQNSQSFAELKILKPSTNQVCCPPLLSDFVRELALFKFSARVLRSAHFAIMLVTIVVVEKEIVVAGILHSVASDRASRSNGNCRKRDSSGRSIFISST